MVIDDVCIKVLIVLLSKNKPNFCVGVWRTGKSEGGRYGSIGYISGRVVHRIAITVVSVYEICNDLIGSRIERKIISRVGGVDRRLRPVKVHFVPAVKNVAGICLIGRNGTPLESFNP